MAVQAPWMVNHWEALVPVVQERLGVASGSIQAGEVAALWLLCQEQATLTGVTDAACSLFTPQVAPVCADADSWHLASRHS